MNNHSVHSASMCSRFAFVAYLLAFVFVPEMHSTVEADDAGKEIELRDCHGTLHAPMLQKSSNGSVVFFLMTDCPISNAYAPEISRIVGDYQSKQIEFFVVYVDSFVDLDQLRERSMKHAKEYELDIPILIDFERVLARANEIKVAPEVMLFTPTGTISYRGRINDLYADYGKRKAKPSQHFLQDAIDAMLADRSAVSAFTKPIGCHVHFSK